MSAGSAGASRRVDIAVVGAGAAGLMAAIFAGRERQKAGTRLSIVVLEGAKKIGAKILVSGGSRCNVTHDVVHPDDFNGSNRNLIGRVLRSFDVKPTVEFFRELGVFLKREGTGKLFPVTDRSRDVVDALLRAAADVEVDVESDARVTALRADGDVLTLTTSRGPIEARRVILATGGRSLPKSGSDGTGYGFATILGHSLRAQTPALVPLLLQEGHWMRELSGISLEVELRVLSSTGRVLRSDEGSMLMTHFGLSGPVVLDVSRHWIAAADEGARLVLNVTGRSFELEEGAIHRATVERPRAALRTLLNERFPERFVDALLHALVIDPYVPLGQITKDDRRKLVHALTALELPVTGDRGYNFAEVTAGGIPLEEVEVATMRSKLDSRLYLCGEVLDVDGKIGGYNFQWAWASGRLAGIAAVKSFSE